MKRRRFIQTVATVPATGLIAQRSPIPTAPNGSTPSVSTSPVRKDAAEFPRLDVALPDSVADTVPRFFSAVQFAALRRLGEVLMPASGTSPGAVDARAPEFLDFLIAQSPPERQHIYRSGLDGLNAEARRRFACSFADTKPAQADELLAPLRQTWTYLPQGDPIAQFLVTAKADLRTATVNSPEWNTLARANGRDAGPSGLYWFPIA